MPLPFIVGGLIFAAKAAAVVAAAGAVIAIVTYITVDVIKDVIKKKYSGKRISATIKAKKSSGDYKTVQIGLRDENGFIDDIEIKGEDIASDVRVGDVIRI